MSRIAGERVGLNYELIERIGAGGMGAVWRARDRVLGRDVALKFLRSGVEPEAGERLLREARATARIRHDAVVEVYECSSHCGSPYLAMELLSGVSLGDYLERRGRLEAAQAVRIMLPIVEALGAAHEQGVVHRDLKPQNIFLCGGPNNLRPKLFDFGLAKAIEDEDAKHLTGIGQIVGSPLYMSPEQARGEPDVDERSDVWALCVVLYQCITGRMPFGGDNNVAVLNAILYNDVVPSTKLGCADAALWHTLRRGLDKEKTCRPSSMQELGAELAAWLVRVGVASDIEGVPVAVRWPAASTPKAADSVATSFDNASVAVGPSLPFPKISKSKWHAGLTIPVAAGCIALLGGGASRANTDHGPNARAGSMVAMGIAASNDDSRENAVSGVGCEREVTSHDTAAGACGLDRRVHQSGWLRRQAALSECHGRGRHALR